MTNATHPDFSRSPLDAAQVAWLDANNIGASVNVKWVPARARRRGRAAIPARYVPTGWGFFFTKGERWIEPISAMAHVVHIMEVDRSEDSDGTRVVATFPRLKDALRYLATI